MVCADFSDSNLGIAMIDPMETIVTMKETLEMEVPLPEPVYQKMPLMLFIVGTIILACAFYLGQNFSWAILYFSGGFVSCMYGVGLYMYRKGTRKPSKSS